MLGGMGNISEDPGQPLDEFSMADWFRRKSGIDPLTVATDRLLALDPNADIDNAGELRAGFAYELVDLQGSGYAAKHFDVSVYVHGSSERGAPDTWLTLRGARMPVAVSLVSCGSSRPCLVSAVRANDPADAIAADRCVSFDSEQTACALYLDSGEFRLVSQTAEGVKDDAKTVHVVPVGARAGSEAPAVVSEDALR